MVLMIFRRLWRRKKIRAQAIDPDEILLDARNLPAFDTQQFEGRLEKPIGKSAFYGLGVIGALLLLVFWGKVFQLQVINGQALFERSRDNTLRQIPIFAERGLILDRRGVELAWNEPATGDNGPARAYYNAPGFGHLLGYISYPTTAELAAHNYVAEELVGRAGVEKAFNQELQGESGIKVEEVDVAGRLTSNYLLQTPRSGSNLTLTIDAELAAEMAAAIKELLTDERFTAGAGVILDVQTGELLVLTSLPEVDGNVLARREDQAAIKNYLADRRQPFLNRATDGLYTPGSIVKPVMAVAALNEKIITPEKQIFSAGQISVPNPFDPEQPSIFKDWKAHGWVDLRRALAVSSNVYFYTIGGGFEKQRGLGIELIDRYAKLFGFGAPTGLGVFSEASGLVPTPEWKKATFAGEGWRLGDTYHTVIGQYGWQVTPLQMARAIGAIATDGRLVTPTILKTSSLSKIILAKEGLPLPVPPTQITGIKPENYQIVREGMRLAATDGTTDLLNLPNLALGIKTGTAELGANKEFVNSWVVGFFPYEKPRYAFAVVMEKGARENPLGASLVVRRTLDWLVAHRPEYLKTD